MVPLYLCLIFWWVLSSTLPPVVCLLILVHQGRPSNLKFVFRNFPLTSKLPPENSLWPKLSPLPLLVSRNFPLTSKLSPSFTCLSPNVRHLRAHCKPSSDPPFLRPPPPPGTQPPPVTTWGNHLPPPRTHLSSPDLQRHQEFGGAGVRATEPRCDYKRGRRAGWQRRRGRRDMRRPASVWRGGSWP